MLRLASTFRNISCWELQRDSSIDAVVAFDAISALGSEEADIDSYVNEVVRVLKPGGAFVFLERGANTCSLKQDQNCCYLPSCFVPGICQRAGVQCLASGG